MASKAQSTSFVKYLSVLNISFFVSSQASAKRGGRHCIFMFKNNPFNHLGNYNLPWITLHEHDRCSGHTQTCAQMLVHIQYVS